MGKVIGFELNSQDPEKASAFYKDVFGWKVSEPKWDYRDVTAEEGIGGGISKGPSDFPHGTRLQIEVDNIEAAIVRATENGAMVVREKMEFQDFYMAYLTDPTGISFGLIERK